MIDLNTLSNILKYGPELTLFEKPDAEDSEAVQFVLRRFLEAALEPLLQPSIEASKDYLQWCGFVASNKLHHMHEVMGLLMQKHSDDLTHIIKTQLPFSETDRYETLWRLLTTTTFTKSTQRPLDILHHPEESGPSWQKGSLGQGRLQASASSFDGDGSRCDEKHNDSFVVEKASSFEKRLTRRDDDDVDEALEMTHPLHRTQLPIHPVCTKAGSQTLRFCGSQTLAEPPRKRVKRED